MSSSARVARSGITSSPASSRARKPRGVQKPAQSSPPVSSTSVVRRGPRGIILPRGDFFQIFKFLKLFFDSFFIY